jgi:hypothetical protein
MSLKGAFFKGSEIQGNLLSFSTFSILQKINEIESVKILEVSFLKVRELDWMEIEIA